MEVRRHECRERASRSRKDASNKENICPLQGRDPNAAELGRRRSPLPEGFPRSPLQDITHIICPHNIWPDNVDPPTGQMRKKFRKDNSAGSCTPIEMETTSSWKGLAPCVHVKFGTKVIQAEETEREKEHSKQSTNVIFGAVVIQTEETAKEEEHSKQDADVEAVAVNDDAKINKHEEDICIHRDDVSNDAISLPDCEIKRVQDAKSGEQSLQTDTQAQIIQHRKSSAEECHANIKQQSISDNCVWTIVGKENHNKRPQQPLKPKKKSSILMFR